MGGSRWWVLVAGLSAACGETPLEPWFHLHIQVAGDEAAAEGKQLRAALAWGDLRDGATMEVTDETDVALGDVAALPVSRSPSIHTWEPADELDGMIARGAVVLYDDRDGDGRLDWTSVTDDGFRDHVVGWVPGLRLLYVVQPNVLSQYDEGFNIVLRFGVEPPVLVPLDTGLLARVLDAPEAACFGVTPPPRSFPTPVAEILQGLEPEPGLYWPYGVPAVDCPGGTLPDDWWQIDCGPDPFRYLVTRLSWPESTEVAELCGWSARYCHVEIDPAEPTPPEYPFCGF